MAYQYQLSDLKRSTVKTVAGVCADSEQFVAMANEVQRRLLKRGNWFDTEWLVKVCVFGRCVVWPRYVGTVLAARSCGEEFDIKNKWYSVIGGASSQSKSNGGMSYEYGGAYWSGAEGINFVDNNRVSTYNNISGNTGKLLRYYVTYQNDIGKTITIYGTKFGGDPLQHQDANGNWVDGLVLTAAAPFATSPVLVTRIDAVVRQATQGNARLFEYDATTDLLRDLALYEPNETNPRYRSSLITNWCNLPSCLDTTTVDGVDYHRRRSQIDVLCKLEHIELVNDQDFLLIDDFDAFKLGFQAIKLEEMNDDQGAETKWLKAVRELNLGLRDKSPDDQIAVAVNVVNGPCLYSPY